MDAQDDRYERLLVQYETLLAEYMALRRRDALFRKRVLPTLMLAACSEGPNALTVRERARTVLHDCGTLVFEGRPDLWPAIDDAPGGQ